MVSNRNAKSTIVLSESSPFASSSTLLNEIGPVGSIMAGANSAAVDWLNHTPPDVNDDHRMFSALPASRMRWSSVGMPLSKMATPSTTPINSSSDNPCCEADAWISLAMENDTLNAKSLPSALSASADGAAICDERSIDAQPNNRLVADATRREVDYAMAIELASSNLQWQLRSVEDIAVFNATTDGVRQRVAIDTSVSYVVVYSGDVEGEPNGTPQMRRGGGCANGASRRRGRSNTRVVVDGAVFGTSVRSLLNMASMLPRVTASDIAETAHRTFTRARQTRLPNAPLEIGASSINTGCSREKRTRSNRVFSKTTFIGLAFAVALLFVILSVHAPSDMMARLNVAFTDTLVDAITHCESILQMATTPNVVTKLAVEAELNALRRGVALVASPSEVERYAAVSARDALHLRVATYMRAAWSIREPETASLIAPSGTLLSTGGCVEDAPQHRVILNLWDVRPTCSQPKLTASTNSSSASGSSAFSCDSIVDAAHNGVSIRRLQTPVDMSEFTGLYV